MLNSENIKLNKNYISDTLEIDLKKVSVVFNNNQINLPRAVTIKLQDKIKIRCLMKKEPLLLFPLMLKYCLNYMIHFSCGHTRDFMINITKALNNNRANFPDGLYSESQVQLPTWVL